MIDQLRKLPRPRQAEMLESEDFLAWLAYLVHEIRSPLATIVTSLKMMELEGLTEQQAQGAARIRRQTQHLARLAEDLSCYSSRSFDFSPRRVNFADIWKEVRETADTALAAKSQRLQESIEDCVEFRGDPRRLVQVFSNLIENASKYSPEGACLTAECRREDGHVLFRVRDDGIGIPREELPHVFEMFYRGSAPERSAQVVGTGLGLAITRRFVEMHGGSIEAKSDGDGKGAEFTVRLPSESPGEAKPRGARGPLSLDGQGR